MLTTSTTGAKDTLWRSNNCYEFRNRRALAKKQKLVDLPRERIMKCKPFTNVQVNLAGDINVKAMCHSRATLEIYLWSSSEP